MRFNKVSVKIGGKDRLMVFSMSTIYRYCEAKGIEAGQISESFQGINKLTSERDIFYCALIVGCEYQDVKPDFNKIKVEEWIEEMEQSEYDKAIKCFAKSMMVEQSEEAEKK